MRAVVKLAVSDFKTAIVCTLKYLKQYHGRHEKKLNGVSRNENYDF